jgi:hypothetical protein
MSTERKLTMRKNPYPNEHAARIERPSRYKRFKRHNDRFGPGVHVIWGILSNGKTEVQAIRFDARRFTMRQVKTWLDKTGYEPIKLEPATKKRRNRMALAIPSRLTKQFSWQSPNGKQRGTFRSNPGGPKCAYKAGSLLYSTTRENPPSWRDKGPTYAATLYVGFSVGDKPTWKMADLVKLVKKVRRQQVTHPDSTFLYQRGVYTHQVDQHVVTEDGAQVILLNVPPVKRKFSEFRRHVITLAEIIADKFKQESVIVAIEKNGILTETIGVVADTKTSKRRIRKRTARKRTARRRSS